MHESDSEALCVHAGLVSQCWAPHRITRYRGSTRIGGIVLRELFEIVDGNSLHFHLPAGLRQELVLKCVLHVHSLQETLSLAFNRVRVFLRTVREKLHFDWLFVYKYQSTSSRIARGC